MVRKLCSVRDWFLISRFLLMLVTYSLLGNLKLNQGQPHVQTHNGAKYTFLPRGKVTTLPFQVIFIPLGDPDLHLLSFSFCLKEFLKQFLHDGFMMMHPFGFCIFDKVFILPSYLTGIFYNSRLTGFFPILAILWHCLLCIVTCENITAVLFFIPLYVIDLFLLLVVLSFFYFFG